MNTQDKMLRFMSTGAAVIYHGYPELEGVAANEDNDIE
jgi:hypothetical protein